MRSINLLLASASRRFSNVLEAQVRDICYEQALINCTRIMGVQEFSRQGSWMGSDLIIVSPGDLRPCEGQAQARVPLSAALQAIHDIRKQHPTPLLAVGVPAGAESTVLDAGVDCVLGLPFDTEEFRSAVSQALGLHAWTSSNSRARWPFAGVTEALMRGLDWLTPTS